MKQWRIADWLRRKVSSPAPEWADLSIEDHIRLIQTEQADNTDTKTHAATNTAADTNADAAAEIEAASDRTPESDES